MMPVLSSCLKNILYHKTDSFSINWLVKGWSYGVKLTLAQEGALGFSVLQIWPILVSCTVCGFSPILALVFGFRQQ